MSDQTQDWAEKIIALSKTVKAPDDLDVPLEFKLYHPKAEEIFKLTWKLGYLAALRDATDIIDEEAVNIGMDAIKEWAENK